jgi:signal transduction histidine kinase
MKMPNGTSMTRSLTASTGFSWFRLGRRAWPWVFAVACGVFLASIPGFFQLMEKGLTPSHLVVETTSSTWLVTALTLLTSITVATVSLTLAWVLFRRGAADPMALFVSYFLVFHGISTAGPIEALEPFLPGIANFNVYVLQPLIFIPMSMTLFAMFPDGRLVPPWTKWLIVVSIAATPISILVSPAFLAGRTTQFPILLAITYIVLFAVAVTMLYAQIYRYRNVSTPLQRQQTKWVILGTGVWFLLVGLSTGPWLLVQSLPPGSALPWWAPVATLVWAASTAVIPVTLALSILRFRLYDVDLIINRTIVYLALTALIVGLYILAATAFGSLFQSNLFIALLATALAAVVFQPLRARLQRAVNRLMYGERDDPYTVLARLGRELESTQSPEAVLSSVVETIAQTLKLPYVAIVSDPGGAARVVASYGLPSEHALSLPLTYQTEAVGELRLARRSSSDEFPPGELRLMQDIARQVSVAAHSVQLTNDLRRARLELVASREEERRRLRRDLHDGLGPALAALNLQAGAIRHLLREDPRQAEARMSELKAEIRSTIDEVRRLVYGLRPPALDELGLVEAIRANAERTNHSQGSSPGVHIDIDAPNDVPAMPAAVEVAAFRIVQEAIANVVHHSGAHSCRVSLSFDRHLVLEVRDDGTGLPEEHRSGVGLISMRERAEELGGTLQVEGITEGGTVVRARLPLESQPG